MLRFVKENRGWFLIFTVVALLSVFVQVMKESPLPSKLTWLQTYAEHIYQYFDGWATVLTATTTLLLAVATFMYVWDNRRIQTENKKLENKRHALEEIRKWAEETVSLLNPSKRELAPASDLNDLQDIFKIINRKILTALAASKTVGGELEQSVDKAVKNIVEFQKAIGRHDESYDYKGFFKDIMSDLTYVLNETFQTW